MSNREIPGELSADLQLYAEEILQDTQELSLRRPTRFRATMTFPPDATAVVTIENNASLSESAHDESSGDISEEANAQLQILGEQLVVPMLQRYAAEIIQLTTEDAVRRPAWFEEHGAVTHDKYPKFFTGGQLALEAFMQSTPDSYMALNVQAARMPDGELFSQSANFIEADPELRQTTQLARYSDYPLWVLTDMMPNIDNALAVITRYFTDEYDDLASGSRLASVAKGNFGALTDAQLIRLRQYFQRCYATDTMVQTHVETAIGLYERERLRVNNMISNPDERMVDWELLSHCHDIVEQLSL